MRAQKRRITATTITEQMLRLACERGFEAVTIDEVAEAAEVSRRTFFNYFASKEDALFGNPMVELSPQLLDRFIDRGPTGELFADALTLVSEQNLFTSIGAGCLEDLHQVLTHEPKLLLAFKQRLHARHDELAGWIATREGLASDDPKVKAAVALLNVIMGLTMERTATTAGITAEDRAQELFTTLALMRGLLNSTPEKD